MEYLLSGAPYNKELCIKSVDITSANLSRRLSELGLVCGQKIKVLFAPTKHNKLIEVRQCVFALDIKVCEGVVVYE